MAKYQGVLMRCRRSCEIATEIIFMVVVTARSAVGTYVPHCPITVLQDATVLIIDYIYKFFSKIIKCSS